LRRALFLCIAAALVARPTPACADEVILTYGDRISGHIIAVTRSVVQIESPGAGLIEIRRRYLEQLHTDDPRIVTLVSGDLIAGQIVPGTERTVTIRSPVLGDLRVPLDTIAAIQAVDPSGQASNEGVRGRGAGSVRTPVRQQGPTGAPVQKPIGQEPEDTGDIRLIFLRQSTVLLRPGQVEVETGMNYQYTQSVSSLLNAKFRQFQMPFAARVGLFDRAEASVALPLAYVRRDLGFADTAVSNDEAGVGDVTAAFNYELRRESAGGPDIISSVGVGVPTGSRPGVEGLSLGTAHWSATVGVQLIKIADPVALFGGIHFEHQFPARYFLGDDVHDVDPGTTGGYNFGFGFAVNEDISLSAQVVGSHQGDLKSDGERVFASAREPVSLRTALTVQYAGGTFIEPSVAIGLNDDTPDFTLGVSLTHRFGR
jgi:outer membrane putative beta-barrel porin/alpha-amylase